jgi:hypothetical protein
MIVLLITKRNVVSLDNFLKHLRIYLKYQDVKYQYFGMLASL